MEVMKFSVLLLIVAEFMPNTRHTKYSRTLIYDDMVYHERQLQSQLRRPIKQKKD